MADLRVRLCGLELRNPILSASGTFGHGAEMQHLVPPECLGGLVSKTVTLEARPGNRMPRIHETEAGFLNSIGLENRGLDAYQRDTLPEVKGLATCIVTNVGGRTAEDYARVAERLDGSEEVDMLELNLSCPNVQGGKLPFSTDPGLAEEVVRLVRSVTRKPILAKLSPNVSRIEDLARAVEAGGADGITAVNTALGMAVDWRRHMPRLATVRGGYSGVGLKPIALRCAFDCVQATGLPVIGCGGIGSAEDVLEYIVAGCQAVEVGTASFSDPSLLARLAREVSELLDQAGIESLDELRGQLCLDEGPTTLEALV